jgi:hypothetical protein
MIAIAYNQKKWALASALLAVLGFNASLNTQTKGNGSFDLSSTTEAKKTPELDGKITTSIGEANVHYVKNGENEILALVPNVNTEGTAYCETCGIKVYTLDLAFEKNQGDIQKLNIALLKKIEADTHKDSQKSAMRTKDSNVEENLDDKLDAEIEKRKTLTEKRLAVLERKCKGEFEEKSKCLSEGLTDLLSPSSADKKYDKQMIQAFVKGNIIPQIKNDLNSTLRGSILALKIQSAVMTNSSPDMVTIQEFQNMGGQEALNQAFAKRNSTMDLMSRFIETVPAAFDNSRGEFIAGQKAILQDEANGIQQMQNYASMNPGQPSQMSSEAIARNILLEDLKLKMGRNDLNSINLAASNQMIEPAVIAQYTQYINRYILAPTETPSGTVVGGQNQIGLTPSQAVSMNPAGAITNNQGVLTNGITNEVLMARLNGGRGVVVGQQTPMNFQSATMFQPVNSTMPQSMYAPEIPAGRIDGSRGN